MKRIFSKELVLCIILIAVFLPFAIRDIVNRDPRMGITAFIVLISLGFLVFSLTMNYVSWQRSK